MSHNQLSPSRIAIEAAGRKNEGVIKASTAGHCAMCGFPHETGEMVAPFAPEGSFTDYASLRKPSSGVICGWCAATWNADFTQKALKSVMCDEGVFPAASNADIAYWLANPPKGNWIWVMGDQKRQHIVWRTTVNTSQEIFQVRFGENLLTIRRQMIPKAIEAAKRLAAIASVGRKGAPLKSPFIRISRDMDDNAHGRIRRDLVEMAANDEQVGKDIQLIRSCTPGELWGLTAALYAEPSGQRPKPYFSKTTSNA